MLKFIKKQWEKETFHFWWILIVILIFSYFLWEYLLDAIDGLVWSETKVFTPLAFWFFSICSIWVVIWYFIIIKFLNYYKIVNKKYKKQVITIMNMLVSVIILMLTLSIITSAYPEHSIETIRKQESWLLLNFKEYQNIDISYSSSTSTDSKWIFSIWHVVKCKNWVIYYVSNFFKREGNINILDKNWKKIKNITIYNRSTKKDEAIIDFNEKEKYFNKLCN